MLKNKKTFSVEDSVVELSNDTAKIQTKLILKY